MSQCTKFYSNSRYLPAETGIQGLLSEPLGSHNKGENTRLISETRPVLTDTGQMGCVGHSSHRMPPGWGWVPLLCLWGRVTITPLTAFMLSYFLLLPQGLCLFRPFRPGFLFKEQVLPIQL